MNAVIRKIHLHLGLSLGLIFVMSGLTGSFLVFYPQIDDWIPRRCCSSPTSGAG